MNRHLKLFRESLTPGFIIFTLFLSFLFLYFANGTELFNVFTEARRDPIARECKKSCRAECKGSDNRRGCQEACEIKCVTEKASTGNSCAPAGQGCVVAGSTNSGQVCCAGTVCKPNNVQVQGLMAQVSGSNGGSGGTSTGGGTSGSTSGGGSMNSGGGNGSQNSGGGNQQDRSVREPRSRRGDVQIDGTCVAPETEIATESAKVMVRFLAGNITRPVGGTFVKRLILESPDPTKPLEISSFKIEYSYSQNLIKEASTPASVKKNERNAKLIVPVGSTIPTLESLEQVIDIDPTTKIVKKTISYKINKGAAENDKFPSAIYFPLVFEGLAHGKGSIRIVSAQVTDKNDKEYAVQIRRGGSYNIIAPYSLELLPARNIRETISGGTQPYEKVLEYRIRDNNANQYIPEIPSATIQWELLSTDQYLISLLSLEDRDKPQARLILKDRKSVKTKVRVKIIDSKTQKTIFDDKNSTYNIEYNVLSSQ